ncbi:hypothetical protein [Serratia ficaria]|uniref:hypothetical protein n=1 Tax=Serratia ficaria TaxID=61651 RepID=UPI0021836F78|nr:hypothetical protein [Serratia ficaria]CAI2499359.1 Uncharacterised protein [Serratia ficaria]
MAMTKCKECKKEVSNKAKTCPHCGVKEPARNLGKETGQGCLGLVILVGVLFFIFGGDDDKDKTKPEKTAEVKECTAADAQCLFDKYMVDAAIPCRELVEKSSKYDFEWTDGIMTPMFSHMRNDASKNQITYIGDKVKFTNGFNAKSTMTYFCTFDWKAKEVVDFKIDTGKL